MAGSPHSEHWSLGDLVDFEVFLQEDEAQVSEGDGEASKALKARDGEFWKEIKAMDHSGLLKQPDSPLLRRWLLKRWIECRRQSVPNPELLPGRLTATALSCVNLLGGVIGIVLGVSACCAALGLGKTDRLPDLTKEPVNVILFLGACVLPQLLMAGFTLCLLLKNRKLRQPKVSPLLRLAYASILRPVFQQLMAHAADTVDRDHRIRVRSASGVLMGRVKIHRKALKWPLIISLQGCAAFYSFAILPTFVIWTAAKDTRFGWQTSYISPRLVYGTTRLIATPWFWMGETRGYPSLQQIERDQVSTKDGIRGTPEEAFKKPWYTFLGMAILVWGFLPRLFLLFYSRRALGLALEGETFGDLSSERLCERLSRIIVEVEHPLGDNPEDPPLLPVYPRPVPQTPAALPVLNFKGCALILPPDIKGPEISRFLAERIQQDHDCKVLQKMSVHSRSEKNACLAELAQIPWPDGLPRLYFVKESYIPPTEGFRVFLGDCQQALGRQAHILICVVGRPKAGNPLTPAEPDGFRNWKDFCDSLKSQIPNLAAESCKPTTI